MCKYVLLLLWCAGASVAAEKCLRVEERSSETRNGPSALCRPRTLDPAGRALETLSEGTADLSIKCSQVLLFESALAPKYFHRFSHLQGLHVDNCKLLRLPVDTFDGLRDLKRLTVRSRNSDWGPTKVLEIEAGAFAGLRELQILDLGDNNVRAVPDDVFCPLDNLHTLNLTRNRLRALDRLGFGSGCGSAVQALDLSHNELRSLTEGSDLARLRRLQRLSLEYNNITDISGEALNGLISLRILNISHNKVGSLPEGIFASSRELTEVDLSHNMLYELARGIFHRLEHLIVLDLSNNQLSSNHIDDGTFVGLIRLIVLNLSHNALTRIDGKTFKDLFFMQILDLRNNSIGFIEDNAFLPLYNLHTLNLAENRLHTIDQHLFNGLYVLSKLTLNNNLLVNIDSMAFKNCSDLKELDLSSNQITQVPEALWELSFLKTLDLGENQISDFKNGSFKNLGQLTGLRLIENQIGNLSKGMFSDMPNLQVLNLAKNKIQSIERGTFDRTPQLEAIRLDGNYISDINGVFSTLASLLWLNLSENHLVWFDYAFIPINLKWLDIHGNFIEHLANYYKMQDEIRVKTLDASHNRIVEISPLSIPNSVELLFINNNFINNIQVNTFLDKKNLTRVDMYANDLVHLELNSLRLSLVTGNRSLPEFYIGGNPFHCDCSMDWLPLINNMTDLRQHPRVMDLENVMCKLTHSHGGTTHMPLTSVKSTDFLCKYETHCFALCHCCDFDACDCEMTCPQNCSCYHDQTWNTNVVDCSAQRVSDIPHRIPMDATEVYLDGNDFKELQNHAFIGRKNMRTLYVNSSGIENIQNRTFTGLNALRVLHLEGNKLSELKGYEFEHLGHLKELYLQNNVIETIGNASFISLYSLEILRLDGNRLVAFPVWQLTMNAHLQELSLGNNQWSCRCKFLQELTSFVTDNAQKIVDIADMWCWNNESKPPHKRELNLNGTACSDFYAGGSVIDKMLISDYLPMTVLTLIGFLLILLALVLLFVFRDPIRVWLYSNYGLRIFSFNAGYEEREKPYDGYVCYSPKDEEFVVQSIAAELENGNPSFQLCLHYRDLPHRGSPFAPATLDVVEAAESSKRVIIVLTRNFLQTEWSRYEFRQALHQALKGRIFKLVLIEEGPTAIPEAACDPDLRPYLKTGSRVRWGEKRFWERLRYAMPDATQRGHKNKTSHNYRRNINTYTLDSSVPNGGHRTLAFPCDKASPVALPPAYCGPEQSPRTPHSHTHLPAYGPDGRPHSDHIYSSIDSDYSTLERGAPSQRRTRPDPRWPNPAQAYLV